MSDFLIRLGRHVRELRDAAGLSQETLAERMGVHATYVSEIEAGGPDLTVRVAERIAAGLGISPAELFRRFDTPPPLDEAAPPKRARKATRPRRPRRLPRDRATTDRH